MKRAKTISLEKLEEMLMGLEGQRANIVTIQTVTPLDMRKTDNPYIGRVFKVATVNCQIQSDYENAVNNRRAKEGKPADFVAQVRTWGTRVGKSCVVEHKGEKYLAYRALRCLKTKLQDGQGRFVSPEVVAPFVPQKSKPKKQGLDDVIIWRTPKLRNIRTININRKRYKVTV